MTANHTARPTEDRLRGLRDYYVGQDVDGAGDVEDLFAEIDALVSAVTELQQERDEWHRIADEHLDTIRAADLRNDAALRRAEQAERRAS